MTTEHTPGPWKFHEYAKKPTETGFSGFVTEDGREGRLIAEVVHHDEQPKAAHKNGFLLAAAPDLLAALDRILRIGGLTENGIWNPDYTAETQAKRAIAKAKGELTT